MLSQLEFVILLIFAVILVAIAYVIRQTSPILTGFCLLCAFIVALVIAFAPTSF